MWGVSRCQAGLTLVSGHREGAPPPSLWGQNGSNSLPVWPLSTCPSPHLLPASWARMSHSHVHRSRQGTPWEHESGLLLSLTLPASLLRQSHIHRDGPRAGTSS